MSRPAPGALCMNNQARSEPFLRCGLTLSAPCSGAGTVHAAAEVALRLGSSLAGADPDQCHLAVRAHGKARAAAYTGTHALHLVCCVMLLREPSDVGDTICGNWLWSGHRKAHPVALFEGSLCRPGGLLLPKQGAMASLRSLLRHCARLRAGVKDPNDPLLANLNILIAITGGFFGQVGWQLTCCMLATQISRMCATVSVLLRSVGRTAIVLKTRLKEQQPEDW